MFIYSDGKQYVVLANNHRFHNLKTIDVVKLHLFATRTLNSECYMKNMIIIARNYAIA